MEVTKVYNEVRKYKMLLELARESGQLDPKVETQIKSKIDRLTSLANDELTNKVSEELESKANSEINTSGEIKNVNGSWFNKNKKSKLKKAGIALATVAILATSGLGISKLLKNNGSDSIVVKADDKDATWDKEIYGDINPYSDESILARGLARKQMYGDQGQLFEGAYENQSFVYFGVSSILGDASDSRLKSLDIDGNANEKGMSLEKALKFINADHQSVLNMMKTGQLKPSWDQQYARVYDKNVLNEFQTIYEEFFKEGPTGDHTNTKEKLDKLYVKMTANSEILSSDAVLDIIGYLETFNTFDQTVFSNNSFKVWVDHVNTVCASQDVYKQVCQEDGACELKINEALDQELSNSSLYRNAMQNKLAEVEAAIKVGNKKSVESDKQSSFVELAHKLGKTKVENKEVAPANERASELSFNWEAARIGGEPLTAEDKANMRPDGTINGGSTVENNVGDKIEAPNTDANGNVTALDSDTLGTLFTQGMNDCASNITKSLNDFSSYGANQQAAYNQYMNGWNTQKDIIDHMGNTSNEEIKEDEVYYNNQVPNVPPVETPTFDNIEKVETEDEYVYWDVEGLVENPEEYSRSK